MTLVQLKHFMVLADCCSYVQAAKRLFVSQPALSRSIMALEDELGQPLFDRIGKRVALTPFGTWVLPVAQQMVGASAYLKALGHDAAAATEGEVRIGLSSGPGHLLTADLLRFVAMERPKLHLAITRANGDSLLQNLRAGRLDAIMVDLRALRPAPDIEVGKPIEIPVDFLCRSDHPLLGLQRPLQFDELCAFPVASTPLSDEAARIMTEHYGPQADPDKLLSLQCDDVGSLVAVAETSDCILLGARLLSTVLVPLPVVPKLNGLARYGVVTNRGRAPAPALALVLDQIQVLFAQKFAQHAAL